MLEPDPERRASTIAEAIARGESSRTPPPPPRRPAPKTPLPSPPLNASSPPAVVAWLTALLRFIAQLLRGRPTLEPRAPARVKRDDVLRGVRVAAPWEAQEEAMRRAGMTDAEAEAWADEVATREAEQWEPPEAWQEEDRKKRER